MNHPVAAIDQRNADVRIGFGMARAEFAQRSTTIAQAEQFAAIHTILAEARAFPEVFLPSGADRTGRDAEDFATRAAVADLAIRLGLAEETVRTQAYQAGILLTRTPRVWTAFRDGDVSTPNARTVAELAATLPDSSPELFAAFDDAVLRGASTLTPARFREQARILRERMYPEQLMERHRRRVEERRVALEPDIDGMCWLSVYMSAEVGQRTMVNLDHAAMSLSAHPDETRTLAQIRADVAGDLLTGGSPVSGGPRVSVAVTVPVMTLLGHSDEPGSLDGYGPIDAETARALAAQAPSFMRILTHPITGAVLDLDRKRYRVPKDLRTWVGIKGGGCTFPGCGRRPRNCDVDHITDWAQGGTTSAMNLHHLCPPHHRLKHMTGWKVERGPDGTIRWTSPTGQVSDADPPPF